MSLIILISEIVSVTSFFIYLLLKSNAVWVINGNLIDITHYIYMLITQIAPSKIIHKNKSVIRLPIRYALGTQVGIFDILIKVKLTRGYIYIACSYIAGNPLP